MNKERVKKYKEERIRKKHEEKASKQKLIFDSNKPHVWFDKRYLRKLPATKTSFGHSIDLEKVFEVENGTDLMVAIFGRKDFGGFHPIGFCGFHQLYKENIIKLFDEEGYVDISINYFNIHNWVNVLR